MPSTLATPQAALVLRPPHDLQVLGDSELAVQVVVLPLAEPVVVLGLAGDHLGSGEQLEKADVVIEEVRGDHHVDGRRVDAQQVQAVGGRQHADLASQSRAATS